MKDKTKKLLIWAIGVILFAIGLLFMGLKIYKWFDLALMLLGLILMTINYIKNRK